jgi:predicted metal-binding transcription factor (methanogenesis marker protein 9)
VVFWIWENFKGIDMKVAEIKKKAKELGITSGKMKKAELIHSIQRAEGNNPCYGSSNGQCSYSGCCFIEDCLKIKI